MHKVIITAAITGSRMMRDIAPDIPITPEEITQSALEAWQAGASIVHLRDPETGLSSQDVELFRRVVAPLRKKTDLSLTTSGIPGRNLPVADRLVPLSLKPELASLDAGSINLGGHAFINTPAFLDQAAAMMASAGVKPEIEIFDLGMMITTLRMRQEGKLADPLHFQFVLGTPWGTPATPQAFLHIHAYLPPGSHVVQYRDRGGTVAHGHDYGRPYPGGNGRQHLPAPGSAGKNQRRVGGEGSQNCEGIWPGDRLTCRGQGDPETAALKRRRSHPIIAWCLLFSLMGFQAVFFQFVTEHPFTDAEDLRRLRLMIPCLFHGFDDHLAFHLFH